MTTDETLRAALHVLPTLQIDILAVLQEGTMDVERAKQLLNQLHVIQQEIHSIRRDAAIYPEEYQRYSAPGQSANKPSDN